MKFGSLGKKALVGGAVSLGTAGLSNCGSGGVVDPPPPVLSCGQLDFLRDLSASVTRNQMLLVSIRYVGPQPAAFQDLPAVTQLEGASLREVRRGSSQEVLVELVPASPLPSLIRFVLAGVIVTNGANGCTFQRGFTIATAGPTIAATRSTLPFDAQALAAIVVTHREGRDVGLAAEARPPGRQVIWTVTGGTFRSGGVDAIVWTLPEEAGLYQAELVVDHGEDGFAFDTLTVEVHPA